MKSIPQSSLVYCFSKLWPSLPTPHLPIMPFTWNFVLVWSFTNITMLTSPLQPTLSLLLSRSLTNVAAAAVVMLLLSLQLFPPGIHLGIKILLAMTTHSSVAREGRQGTVRPGRQSWPCSRQCVFCGVQRRVTNDMAAHTLATLVTTQSMIENTCYPFLSREPCRKCKCVPFSFE